MAKFPVTIGLTAPLGAILPIPRRPHRIRSENKTLGTELSFVQQVEIQAVGPIVAAIVGTLIIGTLATRITMKAQYRRADREMHAQHERADREFRESLAGRISRTAYSMYYRPQHFERWVKHRKPRRGAREAAQRQVEQAFVDDRVALGALQNEVDAYFGKGDPGKSLHKLSDLAMVGFMQMTNAPRSQTSELICAVEGDDHAGLTIQELNNAERVRGEFAAALEKTLADVLSPFGFRSSKILTGPDRRTLDQPADVE